MIEKKSLFPFVALVAVLLSTTEDLLSQGTRSFSDPILEGFYPDPSIYLSTNKAGGFVGCMYALYAISIDRPSSSVAYFDWFEHRGNELVIR